MKRVHKGRIEGGVSVEWVSMGVRVKIECGESECQNRERWKTPLPRPPPGGTLL